MSIKVCGILNLESLEKVLKYPVSAIGFIFYEKSPRYITPDFAKKLSNNIPKEIKKIGVFVNENLDKIKRVHSMVNLDLIQLHGDENQEFIQLLNLPVIKALRVHSKIDILKMNAYNPNAFLLDTYQPGIFGGTGESFNWKILENIQTDIPIILSGGLNPLNILEATHLKNVSAWDINSGVEKYPGEKDYSKLKNLFSKINFKSNNNLFNEI